MADGARAISCFWDILLHSIAPAHNKGKKRKRRAKRSVFCCNAVEVHPLKFWFCQTPRATRKPAKSATQRPRTKKVHFSDHVQVILIDRGNQTMM
ncbi:hypothetical protein C3747_577g10 [Trypanosoma cruzi]|uniref:Uncharacterized protein n=2 Tax=Trypanosoma cruzi TaxID=5693 RepID=Q4D925_TRYCC|nr:hypothetical protein, conserved [Trypanosoma cruzi]EAN89032.1 hypothetical protein, conserved [Trypanosoma cruzi]PWU85993.1 hypothetical protein C3747_577g10 [Trypanosoma cruzi]|eukprot:XP_810883.1 hypothetical protein [Trypanosoma cruzi strain CL Brener]